MRKVYQELAHRVQAIQNCKESKNALWEEKHKERIESIVKHFLPHGSGFDSGCTLDLERSKPEHLVITTAFHHMDDNGTYHHWQDYTVHVTPSLAFGLNLRITGRDWHDFKDYAYEEFQIALGEEFDVHEFFVE